MSILNDLKICYYLSKVNKVEDNKKEIYEQKLRKVLMK